MSLFARVPRLSRPAVDAALSPHLPAIRAAWEAYPASIECPRCQGSGRADWTVTRNDRNRATSDCDGVPSPAPWYGTRPIVRDGQRLSVRVGVDAARVEGIWTSTFGASPVTYGTVVNGKPCGECEGAKRIDRPDLDTILSAILAPTKRPSILGLRSKRPKDWGAAYVVWRFVRFHGGADVTLPMGAGVEAPAGWLSALDDLARALAMCVTGKAQSAGGARWRSAMTGTLAPEGLPATAYACGPEVDGYAPGDDPCTDVALHRSVD